MIRKFAMIALVVVALVGLGTSAAALAWKPEAYSRYAAAGPLACDRGIGMWLWGISSDGSSGRGPLGGGEQKADPRWEAECGEHLRMIQIATVTGIVIALVGLSGAFALSRSTRRAGSRLNP